MRQYFLLKTAMASFDSVEQAGAAVSAVIAAGLIPATMEMLDTSVVNVSLRHNFLESLLFGFGSALGFTLALILFAGIRERLEGADVPVHFRGTAIGMVTAGVMSLAFMGFAGLDKFK